MERFFCGTNLLELEIRVSSISEFTWKCPKITYTVKLGDKERFDKEQIGVKEPFPVTNLSLHQSSLKYLKMFLNTLYVLSLILTLFRLLLYNLHAMFGWFLPYKFCNTSSIHQGPNWFKMFRGLHWNWRYFLHFNVDTYNFSWPQYFLIFHRIISIWSGRL